MSILALAGCIQDEPNSAIYYDAKDISWSGMPDDNEYIHAIWDKTCSCLNMSAPEPHITFIAGPLYIDDTRVGAACSWDDGIFVTGELYPCSRLDYVLAHEMVHWITGLGEDAHDRAEFSNCAQNPAILLYQ
jgi:hypothetical protein